MSVTRGRPAVRVRIRYEFALICGAYRQNRISLPAKVTTTVVVILLVPNLATCQLYGASVAKEDLCFLHLPWETNTTRSVSADYHEIRARNYIPVPNTTFPILKKGF